MGLPVRALFAIFHPCVKVIPFFRELLWKNEEKIAKTPMAEVCGIHLWIIPKNLSTLVTKGTMAELREKHIFLHPPKWCPVLFTSIDQKTWNFKKSRALTKFFDQKKKKSDVMSRFPNIEQNSIF